MPTILGRPAWSGFICLFTVLSLWALSCTTPRQEDGSDVNGSSGGMCSSSDCETQCQAEECCDSGDCPIGSTGGAHSGTGGSSALVGEADIVASPPSGTFVSSVEVSLETFRANGVIHYSTEGSSVTFSSPTYDESSLVFSETTELRARVFVDGVAVGQEVIFHYLARDFDLVVDLPIVVLDSFGAPAPDREYIPAAFFSFESPGTSLADAPTVATRAGFHLRGQSTATFEKAPYRIELRDGDDEDADYPLLGMPAESDWALRGPFADKALIRDAFFYGLGAEMGMVAPRFAYCEFYRNVGGGPLSEDDYMGVYLVVETIKNSKARLDLKQLDPTKTAPADLSGGYIFKFEWLAAEEPIIPCPSGDNCWSDLEVHDPSTLAPAQATWLQTHLRSFVDALYSPQFSDVASGYASYIDVDSFIDQIIINELGREMDAYIRSAYFHKDRDGKIVAGPLWDYNLSLDVGGFFQNRSIEGFQYEQQRQPINNDWMGRLLDDPAFVAQLTARWQSLRSNLLSDAALDARIDALTAPIAAAAERNFNRWPNLTNAMVGPFNTPTEPTWQGQVGIVRNWVKARAAWLDTAWQ
jgi:hypothetical protein